MRPPIQVEISEGLFQKLANRVRLARCQDVIGGCLLLQNAPHSFHVFRSVSPIAACIEISQVELGLPARLNPGDRARDFAGHEGFSAAWTLMIEENSISGKHAVSFPVVHSHPMAINFSRAVWAARMEGCLFALRRRRRAKHLRRSRLIETAGNAAVAHSFEDS